MSDEEAREEVGRLEREWMEAHQARDRDRLEELVADGFRFTAIHLHPEPMSREQWMGAALGGYTITTFAFEDVEIEVFGETAVVLRPLLADRVVLDRQPLERVPADRRLVEAHGPVAGRRAALVRAGLSVAGAGAALGHEGLSEQRGGSRGDFVSHSEQTHTAGLALARRASHAADRD